MFTVLGRYVDPEVHGIELKSVHGQDHEEYFGHPYTLTDEKGRVWFEDADTALAFARSFAGYASDFHLPLSLLVFSQDKSFTDQFGDTGDVEFVVMNGQCSEALRLDLINLRTELDGVMYPMNS